MNSEKVFELRVQRLETLEELEIQYSQALAKLEQEIISHNTLSPTHDQRDSHRILFARLFPFLYRYNPL